MSDFKAELIALIEARVPKLRTKIQHAAVEAKMGAPYAAFTEPETEARRTIHGVWWENGFDILVLDTTLRGAEELRDGIIAAVDGTMIGEKRCRVKSYKSEYDPDFNLHGYDVRVVLK